MIKSVMHEEVRFCDCKAFPFSKILRFFFLLCSYVPGENYIVLEIECYPIKNILLSFIIEPLCVLENET